MLNDANELHTSPQISPSKGGKREAGRPGRKSKKAVVEDNEEVVEECAAEHEQVVPSYDLVEQLVSPVRFSQVFEHWSPLQVAVFEAGICQFGRQWSLLAQVTPGKDRNEVISFYYLWKQSSHYRVWKVHQNIANKSNLNHWL